MVDAHNQSFFGTQAALFIQSSSKSDPFIFLKLIKKKSDGSWERLTSREGITIKCGLEEMIMILSVLRKNRTKWTTVHGFKEEKKSISFNWDEKSKLWIHVENYSKQLVYPQTELLTMLLEHILQEKIEFSTVSSGFNENIQENTKSTISILNNISPQSLENNKLYVVEEKKIDDNITSIKGKIKNETDAALYIEFDPEQELWVAKSKIRSDFDPQNQEFQEFLIDSWILRKNKIIT
ncbi:MAG: hypothetical protein ACFFHD_14210 [Promethearchaeota archaeon]